MHENEISCDDHDIAHVPQVMNEHLNEWIQVTIYAPEFADTGLDIPDQAVNEEFFQYFQNNVAQEAQMQDILLAHRITDSGRPNKYGCRIPLHSKINLALFDCFLLDYEDREIIDWLTFGFSIARSDKVPDPQPANCNHLGATRFPRDVDQYIESELSEGHTLGPFNMPPFTHRIGISPLSSRPKKEINKCRIILDLSYPIGASVNDGISKFDYCGKSIRLSYPTIDTLAARVFMLGRNCLMWKKDLWKCFRQLILCPRDFSLIGYRWRNMLFFDKVMPMGLRSATYVCQRLTNAIVYVHKQMG